MRKTAFTILILVLLAASGTQAQCTHTVFGIQTGAYEENILANCCELVVVAVRDIGIYVAEPPYSAFCGIWVFTGPGHGRSVGDLVNISGEYKETNGLSEIDIVSAGPDGYLLPQGTSPVPPPSHVSAEELMNSSVAESFESCAITIVDGLQVIHVAGPEYGEWLSFNGNGIPVQFHDYWYDHSSVTVGDCYNNATGIYNYLYTTYFSLEPFVDGLAHTDCTVPTQFRSFGAIKAIYR